LFRNTNFLVLLACVVLSFLKSIIEKNSEDQSKAEAPAKLRKCNTKPEDALTYEGKQKFSFVFIY
jgi:hypothetical protein